MINNDPTARIIASTDAALTRAAIAAAYERQRADDAARSWIMPDRPADRSRNMQRAARKSQKRRFIR